MREVDTYRPGFSPRAAVLGTALALLVLVPAVVVPQWLSREARIEVLRAHVAQIARVAASVVDGDLHRQLLDPARYSEALYEQALAPLLRFHAASPELYYVYTMLDRGSETLFVLDTAMSPELVSPHDLTGSPYMEPFVVFPEHQRQWQEQVARREPWVYPFYQHDEYGYFLSGHAPIFDSEGRYAGFVGVDFGIDYYLGQEQRFRLIGYGALLAVVLVALLVGVLWGHHYHRLQQRIDARYRTALRDELTGLFNRRGALQRMAACLRLRGCGGHALLHIDLDGLDALQRTRGHTVADQALCAVAGQLRELSRDSDTVARIEGGTFLLFAPETGPEASGILAEQVLERLRPMQDLGPVVGVAVSVPGVDAETLMQQAVAATCRVREETGRAAYRPAGDEEQALPA